MEKKLTFGVAGVLSFCFLVLFAYAEVNIGEELYKLFEMKDNVTKKELVINFCKVLADNPKISSFDASKSIFLNLLCNKTQLYTDKKFAENVQINSSFVKYINFSSFTNRWDNDTVSVLVDCRLVDGYNVVRGSLNHINFSCVAEKIFDSLASDILNIISAKVYGFASNEKNLLKWQEKLFGKQVCKNGNYLNFTASSKVSLCNHPFTFKYIKNISRNLKSLLNNLNVLQLNTKDISEFVRKLGYKPKNDKLDMVNDTIHLKNLIYNELFFYNLFLVYYKASLENQSSTFKMLKIGTNVYEIIHASISKQIKEAERLLYLSNTVINKSFLIIKDIYWTFPIHIGLMAILEDLNAFRKALAKIYTPLDQLRYKLKNVQDLDLK